MTFNRAAELSTDCGTDLSVDDEHNTLRAPGDAKSIVSVKAKRGWQISKQMAGKKVGGLTKMVDQRELYRSSTNPDDPVHENLPALKPDPSAIMVPFVTATRKRPTPRELWEGKWNVLKTLGLLIVVTGMMFFLLPLLDVSAMLLGHLPCMHLHTGTLTCPPLHGISITNQWHESISVRINPLTLGKFDH
jgi:hypothetical protein